MALLIQTTVIQHLFGCRGFCSFSAKRSYGFTAQKLQQAKLDNDSQSADERLTIQPLVKFLSKQVMHPVGRLFMIAVVIISRASYLKLHMFVSLTVDVQENRSRLCYKRLGKEFNSWLVDHGELWGETDKPDVWSDLDQLFT
ncbi:MAG: terminase gpA endonuclease subunit [Patescibacteria group bacterium]|nr:terminase gpA endonuclease subunit [Patescibacteria group bacterium]